MQTQQKTFHGSKNTPSCSQAEAQHVWETVSAHWVTEWHSLFSAAPEQRPSKVREENGKSLTNINPMEMHGEQADLKLVPWHTQTECNTAVCFASFNAWLWWSWSSSQKKSRWRTENTGLALTLPYFTSPQLTLQMLGSYCPHLTVASLVRILSEFWRFNDIFSCRLRSVNSLFYWLRAAWKPLMFGLISILNIKWVQYLWLTLTW